MSPGLGPSPVIPPQGAGVVGGQRTRYKKNRTQPIEGGAAHPEPGILDDCLHALTNSLI